MRKNHTLKVGILVAGDFCALLAALGASLWTRYANTANQSLIAKHTLPFMIVFAVWIIFFGAFGLYELRLAKNTKYFLFRLLQAVGISAVASILFFYLLPFGIEPRRNLALIALSATVLIFAWRYVFNLLAVRASAARVLFLGVTKETAALADYLAHNPQFGQKPIAFLPIGQNAALELLPIPSLDAQRDLGMIIQEHAIDTVVMLHTLKENKTVVRALLAIIPLGVAIVEFSAFYERLTGKVPASLIEEIWFLENLIGTRKRFYEFFKRVFDILLALVLGCITLAFFPFVALGIALSTPRDILHYKERRARKGDGIFFFRQQRVGKDNMPFAFIKFRSQRLGAEQMSRQLKEAKEVPNDPRHYWFGQLMRKTYFDELPQIINILKGEMSFIGPRPERPEYVNELKYNVPFYEMRLLVPPGITGWAQIHMENDAAVEDAPEKMQYDLYYIKNRSFTLDLLIALRTIFTLLQRQGR
ncbi:MAG: sugar transferase [Candidatus Sungbacteria bacterium]|nr:sugar transferase [Candidatus Sungbacteria bacterium]